MPAVRANGIEIYYELHGTGEPVVLIMGLGANITAWDSQLEPLSREYQLIALDNRGAGRSEKPAEPYSIHQMADDTAALMDELGVHTAHVFGMSMGGMIAQEMYHRHGARVRSLILAGTMAGGPMATFPNPKVFQQFVGNGANSMEEAVAEGLKLFYSEQFLAENKDWLVKRAIENMSLMAPPHALQKQVMAVMGFNAHGLLSKIQVPTMVIGGTEDQIVPFPNQQLLANRIPEARFVPFEGAGHGFLTERAVAVNRAVLDFLGEHRTHFVPAR
ncbi:MAG TPA: alpha/beta fold hydrolase [Dehalococcoidia bacterium]